MFLIIDFYLNKYKDFNFDMDDYEYLKFKDNIMIVGNKVINDIKISSTEINFPKFQSIKYILLNFKFFLML
uniref:hypothetical protein n=1 Tax=Aliarcobacter sp. TaxID=2321116 RepID=UPI004047127B